jgi:alkyl hydroperoxide reductase subunit AhpC
VLQNPTMRALAAALLVTLALPAVAPADEGAEPAEEIAVGLPAPNFALRTLNVEATGTTWLALDRYAGEEPEDPASRMVILSFFASWCGRCGHDLPFLERLYGEYRDQGLRVVAICVDSADAGIAATRRLLAASRISFPVLADRSGELSRRYLGEALPLPSVFVLGRDAILLRTERGYARDVTDLLLSDVQAGLGIPMARSRQVAPQATPVSGGRAP